MKGAAMSKNKKKRTAPSQDEPILEAVPETVLTHDLAMTPAPNVEIPRNKDFTPEDFIQSVDTLTAQDIMEKNTAMPSTEKSPQKRKRSKAANFLQLALLGIFGSVLVVSLIMLGQNIWGKIEGSKIYDEASDQFNLFIPGQTNTAGAYPWNNTLSCLSGDAALQSLFDRINSGRGDGGGANISGYDQQLEQMRASLTSLREINSDVYGWIYVENTKINYPILRGTDNDYYLDHSYNHNYLPIGSIFLDAATKEPITDNFNAVLYGHNVAAGSMMFHDVTKFLNADTFYNSKIYIYTMEGVYIYQPVSIYQTTSDYQYFRTEFGTEASFLEFASEVVSNSKFPSDTTFASGDTMITFSTCTNGAPDGRYALHAKLVETVS